MLRKVLIVDDNVYKKIDIQRAVERLGVEVTDWEKSLETALNRIRKETDCSSPYDLVITDMDFPKTAGGDAFYRSGELLVKSISDAGFTVPVILCSSVRYRIPGVAGCVWYSDLTDLDAEFRNLFQKLNKN